MGIGVRSADGILSTRHIKGAAILDFGFSVLDLSGGRRGAARRYVAPT
jgi:hypothetical protein